MFSKIGVSELLVIFIIGLFVIGPEKLPGAARSVGKVLGSARKYLKDVTSEVEAEMRVIESDITEAEKDVKESLKDPLKDSPKEIKPAVAEKEMTEKETDEKKESEKEEAETVGAVGDAQPVNALSAISAETSAYDIAAQEENA